MRYAQNNSKYVCSIDLHAREMYACVMNEKKVILASYQVTACSNFSKNNRSNICV